MCSFFCLVCRGWFDPYPARGVDLGGLEQQHLTDTAAGQKRQPERQRGVAGAVSVECRVGGLDLGRVEEDVALIFRPTAHALARIAVDLAVVFEPAHECGHGRKGAVGIERCALGDLAVPVLDGVAGDRPRLALAEVREDVAVDQAAVAVGGARPPREPDDVAPLLDQVSNPPPRPGETVSPVSALSRRRLA